MMTTTHQKAPDFITVDEAAELMRVSDRTIYRWLREGQFEYFRVGHVTRIDRADFFSFIEENTKEAVDE